MSGDSFLPVWVWQSDRWVERMHPGHLGQDVDVWLRQLETAVGLGSLYVFWQHRRGSLYSLAQHPREEDYARGTQRPAMVYWPLWTQILDATYPTHPRFFTAGRAPPKRLEHARRLIDHVHVHAGHVVFFAMRWKDVLQWLVKAGVNPAESETIAYQYYGMCNPFAAMDRRIDAPGTSGQVMAIWIEETWGTSGNWQQYLAQHPTCWGGIHRRSSRSLDWMHRRHAAVPRVTQLGDWVYWAHALDHRFARWMLWQDVQGVAVEVWGWADGVDAREMIRWKRVPVQEAAQYTRCVGVEGYTDAFARQWRWWWSGDYVRPVWTTTSLYGQPLQSGCERMFDNVGEWQSRYSLSLVTKTEWLQIPDNASWPTVGKQWVWWKFGVRDGWRKYIHWDMAGRYGPPDTIRSTNRWLLVPADQSGATEDEEEAMTMPWKSRVAGYAEWVDITWQVHGVVIDIVPDVVVGGG